MLYAVSSLRRSVHLQSLKFSTKMVSNMLSVDFEIILKDAQRRNQVQIIDCRERNEVEYAKIPGQDIIYLPLSAATVWTRQIIDNDPVEQLSFTGLQEHQHATLDSKKTTICLCHHGVRSMRVASFLGAMQNSYRFIFSFLLLLFINLSL